MAKLDIAVDSDSKGRGFESLRADHVGANVISFAPTFFQKSERTHSVAPPFQITTACAGLRFGFGCNPEACGIYTVAMFHTCGEQVAHRRFSIFKAFLPAFLAGIFFINVSHVGAK